MKAAGNLGRILAMGAVVALSTAVPSPASAAQQSPTGGAAQQSNQPNDIEITRNIRRAVVKDKTLSTAHNVTIITKGGKVTLKGRVKSDAEKQTVETAAATVAGAGNVDDQLTTR
jgi:osmotically-inducible protein OsmY